MAAFLSYLLHESGCAKHIISHLDAQDSDQTPGCAQRLGGRISFPTLMRKILIERQAALNAWAGAYHYLL